jgi:hypothetical protein
MSSECLMSLSYILIVQTVFDDLFCIKFFVFSQAPFTSNFLSLSTKGYLYHYVADFSRIVFTTPDKKI